MCANGEPFETVKDLMLRSLPAHTQRELIIHNYNLEKMKSQPWFEKIKDLPNIPDIYWRRDGYYNAYKMFCVMDAYESMNEETDVLVYMDSSKYYSDGFTESVDKLCDVAFERGIVAGSTGDDVKNGGPTNCGKLRYILCDNLSVWRKVWPDCNESVVTGRHILNAWFAMRKSEVNTQFMKDWIYWSLYTDSEFKIPLITQHISVDQSIFNILVRKYGFSVFYHKDRYHCLNKDKNGVLKVINETAAEKVDELFITL